MSNFLHAREWLDQGDIVVVAVDRQCNVLLMDDSNFSNYRNRRAFHYRGGLAKVSPIRLAVPSTGYWNVAIDLGGGSGTIRHSINYIRRNAA